MLLSEGKFSWFLSMIPVVRKLRQIIWRHIKQRLGRGNLSWCPSFYAWTSVYWSGFPSIHFFLTLTSINFIIRDELNLIDVDRDKVGDISVRIFVVGNIRSKSLGCYYQSFHIYIRQHTQNVESGITYIMYVCVQLLSFSGHSFHCLFS